MPDGRRRDDSAPQTSAQQPLVGLHCSDYAQRSRSSGARHGEVLSAAARPRGGRPGWVRSVPSEPRSRTGASRAAGRGPPRRAGTARARRGWTSASASRQFKGAGAWLMRWCRVRRLAARAGLRLARGGDGKSPGEAEHAPEAGEASNSTSSSGGVRGGTRPRRAPWRRGGRASRAPPSRPRWRPPSRWRVGGVAEVDDPRHSRGELVRP